jgi:hypothetical protein
VTGGRRIKVLSTPSAGANSCYALPITVDSSPANTGHLWLSSLTGDNRGQNAGVSMWRDPHFAQLPR